MCWGRGEQRDLKKKLEKETVEQRMRVNIMACCHSLPTPITEPCSISRVCNFGVTREELVEACP